ncbi:MULTISPECIES: FeoB-associated Cys-rich membrane protein [unclassified Neisseria]|nr:MULTISPECIES: FeoB-associated Cys-rich membrane protein [unclassified Neisseria]MDO1509058.1 FeoB-associated Cys-rich membrane protein [Neisseria sp. MVDL19-042950]MDO1515317.1 FeoB-associated Cys-rich membrane protein [Neisseria sp. MVDL18-041461]MDO1562677.1 FeoB-associated Cys-rich membrane protein [Neisseria sp. MVDL20-010259]
MEQYIIVGIIVVLCVLYILRKFVFKSKAARNSACGGCDRCSGKSGGCH